MEGKSAWHGKVPNDELFEKAFDELRLKRDELEAIDG
jgi:hypothetical protein